MSDIRLLHPTGNQKRQIAFLVQKINGFFEKEERLLFFFEHKEGGYEGERLRKQMNRQLFYMEEMLKKQIKNN